MPDSTVSIEAPNPADGESPVPLERLEAEICELAGHLWAATARFLVLVEEFDRREGWAGWGMKSCAHWVSWKCGPGMVAAREHVRIARRLVELPLIREAFGRGELAYAKVRALCRVADTNDEAKLLDLAREATTVQLETIVRAWRVVKDDIAGRKTAERHARRHVSWHYDDDGSLVLRARLDPEDGGLVVAALEAASTALQYSAVEEPEAALDDARASSRSGARRADALVRVAQAALASDAAAAASDDRHLVVVHVDAATPAAEPYDGRRCHLEDGPGLAPATARRLACDAGTVVVTHDDAGQPLDVGRRTRAISPALRRALRCRDGGCRAPGCTERRFVDAHHIRHWSQGGETSLANLVLLCRRHHRMVHEGVLSLSVTAPGSFRFSRSGAPIPVSPAVTRATGPGLPSRHRRAGLDITSQTTQPLGQGDTFDLGVTIDGLVLTAAS